jgi:hypothetical protein
LFMARKLSWVGAAALALCGTVCFGQDAFLEELYGRGVHAYFSQNLREAFDSLNTAIKSGSRDPRAFYFRGLVLNRFGRPDEARDDFRKGAELEMLGGEPYPVGRALERIQGPERIALESQRQIAKLAIHNTQSAQDRVRYEQVKRAEAEMLPTCIRHARIGSAIFFSVCKPISSKQISTLPRSWRWVSSEMQTPPGSAIASRRAAMLTASPKISLSSMMISPT